MKRLTGLCGIASISVISCIVLESSAAKFETVSETPQFSAFDIDGDPFVIDIAEMPVEILMIRDRSFTYVVEGKNFVSIYKSTPVAACRSPGGLPNRF